MPGPRLVTARFVLLVVSGIGYFVAIGSLLPVLPRYVRDETGGGDVAVGLVFGVFSIGAIAVRPSLGRLGDRSGRRILVVGGAIVAGASIALYGATESLVPLVAARVLTGVGEAAYFVGAATTATDLAPPERRGEAVSYFSVAVYGGLAFGPVLGEQVLQAGGFGAVWWTAVGLCAWAAVLGTTVPVIRHPEHERRRLLHPLGLPPGVVLGLGLVAVAGFAAFVPLYVEELGMGDSGALFMMYGGLVLAVRVVGARIPDALGPRRSGTGALTAIAAGMALVAAWGKPAGLYAGVAVFAVGMSLLFPALMALAVTDVPESERTSVVGTFTMFFDLAQGGGALLLGAVAAAGGYRAAFLAAATLALAGLALLLGGIDPRARRDVAGPVAVPPPA